MGGFITMRKTHPATSDGREGCDLEGVTKKKNHFYPENQILKRHEYNSPDFFSSVAIDHPLHLLVHLLIQSGRCGR